MPRMHRTRPTLLFALIIGLITATTFLASACGSSTVAGEPAKDTIPLADDDPRDRARSVQQDFSACLDDAGYEFRGFAGDEGDAAVIEEPGYQDALRRCATESGIAALREEFAESRAARTPEQVRADNEVVLAVVDCLRAEGLDLDDPVQDETGALDLRRAFAAADVDVRDDQRARDCLSEVGFARSGGG